MKEFGSKGENGGIMEIELRINLHGIALKIEKVT